MVAVLRHDVDVEVMGQVVLDLLCPSGRLDKPRWVNNDGAQRCGGVMADVPSMVQLVVPR